MARIVAPYQDDSPVAVEHATLLALLYGDCLMAVEINNSGSYWNYELLNAGRTLYHRTQYDRERQANRSVLGWQTNPTTRPIIVEHLAALLRASADPDQADAGCHIYCPHALQECLTFVVDPRGTPRAQDGCYDDDVMALAIGFFLVESCASVYGAPPG